MQYIKVRANGYIMSFYAIVLVNNWSHVIA